VVKHSYFFTVEAYQRSPPSTVPTPSVLKTGACNFRILLSFFFFLAFVFACRVIDLSESKSHLKLVDEMRPGNRMQQAQFLDKSQQ
jgi:hypothetical protein